MAHNASAAPPLKTVLVGLDERVSLASGRRAMRQNYVQEMDSLFLEDGRTEQEQLITLVENKPDLIFVVGGTDNGAEKRLLRLVETINLGMGSLAALKSPHTLFAGNIKLREQVKQMIGNGAGHLRVAENVRPTLAREQITDAARQIGEIYDEVKVKDLTGSEVLQDWSTYNIIPTAQSLAHIVQFFAALQKQNVLAVDLGSDSAGVVFSDPEIARLSVRSDLGMGRPVSNLLHQKSVVEITRWSLDQIEPDEMENFIQNKALHPRSIPTTAHGMQMEQAAAQAMIQQAVSDAASDWGWDGLMPQFGVLLARGGVLANINSPGQVVMLLLNAIQPSGVFAIGLDKYGVLPALGILAQHNPLAAVQVLEGSVLVNLGWVVALFGTGKHGKKAISVSMKSESGQELVGGDVAWGDIEVLTLTPGESAQVILKPERGVDIGFGPGEETTITLYGGAVGLVIDARGRPLTLPDDDGQREEILRQWLWDIGG
ncbi:MAG: glutamate mutase L [Anaerolineae bacterium]